MSRTTVRAALSAIGLAVLGAALFGVATPAHAALPDRDGECESGEFCYYYNSNQAGSVSDHTGSLANYGSTQPTCYEFIGPGNGRGQCIKNNAASVRNLTSYSVRVYFNSNYGGTFQTIAPGASVNLNPTLKNNNASHRLIVTDAV
jgi:hypothetical protein